MWSANVSLNEEEKVALLDWYNDLFAIKYLPAIVFVAALMTIGLVGNVIVFCVYVRRFGPSPMRCFILSLAVIDLLNCSIGCPFDIADMRYRYTFGTYVAMCKTMRVFITFTSISSGCILLLLAVDRYRKICRPLRKQMTITSARVAILVCCVASAVSSAPAAVMWGPRTVTTNVTSVNGSDCSTPDTLVGTSYPLIYNAFNVTIFVTSSAALTVLYVLIWRQVKKQRQYKIKREAKNIRGKIKSSDNSTAQITEYSSDSPSSKHEEATSSQYPSPQRTTSPRRHQRKENWAIRKTTLMCFIITLVYVLSYLPFLCLVAVRALNKKIFDDLNTVQFGAFYLFFKSYFINSALNPIVYSFFNFNFRRELVNMFKCKYSHQ